MNKQLDRYIIDSLPYAILVLSRKLVVIECNRSCETFFSKTKSEILGSDLSEIIPRSELRGQAKAVLRNGGTKLVELHLDPETPVIYRAVVIALEAADQGGNTFCLITLEDISRRAQLESQLVESEKAAGMGLLATTIAHELGNPLSIMISTLQYIRDTLLNTKDGRLQTAAQVGDIVKAVETIMDSTERMHELLRVLSGFIGSQLPRFEPTDLRQILSQMLAFIHSEAEAHKIRVHHRSDDNIPNCQVDSREVKQLFLNLLKNAIEAMPDGGELRIRIRLDESKDGVCVSISDTGHGISETELRSIFKPFYSTKPDGTGLGLSFCRHVVEEHGGEINVKSELQKGSTFTVVLPIRQGGNYDSCE